MTKANPVPANKKELIIALRELLETGMAGTQEDIKTKLQNQGYNVSQPQISRLLNKLSAIKVNNTKGQATYRLSHDYGLAHELMCNTTQSSIQQLITGIMANEMLIIVHTNPGAASLVARIIDQERSDLNILGCIAGDDTIFIAPLKAQVIPDCIEKLNCLFFSN